jgi:SAM-dependent methyltransferase
MAELQQPDSSWYEVDPAFYANGGVCFNAYELDGIGEVDGATVLVAPPGNGEEALSFANLGGQVTVLSDPESMAQCRALVENAGAAITFVQGDGGDASSLPAGTFDLVYAPWGTLDWLEAFDDWAEGVARVLKPGGRLVLYDRHPVSTVAGVHKGLFLVAHSYFGSDEEKSVSWTLGEVISSLGQAGMATMLLEEAPDSDRFVTPLDRLNTIRWDVRWRLPAAMLLVALKVAE